MSRLLTILFPILIAYACSSCSDAAKEATPTETRPLIKVDALSVAEGNSGTVDANLQIRLTGPTAEDVTFSVRTIANTATEMTDYVPMDSNVTLLAGNIVYPLSLKIVGDLQEEPTESFNIEIYNISSNVITGSSVETVSTTIDILNDDGPAPLNSVSLNDTGATVCANELSSSVSCDDESIDGLPGQDGHLGRDVTSNDPSDGYAGFSFTKLDNSGQPLANQASSFSETPWYCVRDNTTGLVWETKTIDQGLHDNAFTYSWYNTSGVNDGGNQGQSDSGNCAKIGTCDTESFINQVNNDVLCGYSDWRLPTVSELISIVNNSIQNPAVDVNYFPNTMARSYFTATPTAGAPTEVWGVDFLQGRTYSTATKSKGIRVRLVRSD